MKKQTVVYLPTPKWDNRAMSRSFSSFKLLDIRIDNVNFSEAVEFIFKKVKEKKQALVVTPNPEIILIAQDDIDLKEIINKSDLSLPDGSGISWAMDILGYSKNVKTVKGRDVARSIIEQAKDKKIKIALIGDDSQNAIRVANKYNNEYIKGFVGPRLFTNGFTQTKSEEVCEGNLLKMLKSFSPQIILVGFGAPKQEKWLSRVMPKLNNTIGMVVGGTFDYMSGSVPMPPKYMENYEWLWRLVTQPSRFFRILTAVVIFPLTIIIKKLQKDS